MLYSKYLYTIIMLVIYAVHVAYIISQKCEFIIVGSQDICVPYGHFAVNFSACGY